MDAPRTILHADLDAFFASVEQLDHADMRGKPVLVGGRTGRSVVAAASYEARAFGCRSAMPMARALTLCPHAVVASPRFERYSELSDRFMEILGRYSPIVEALSVDEAFIDVTGSRLLYGDGLSIARALRKATHTELGLTVSVGIGPNKFIAKLASDMNKPDGITEAPLSDPALLASWLAPIGIERMWGIGPKSLPRFHAARVFTFGDLQRMANDEVIAQLGNHAHDMRMRALGIDNRAVETARDRKGVGHETTFADDVTDPESVLETLQYLAESASRRLRGGGGTTRRITIKIRFGDFETITRSSTLDADTDRTLVIIAAAKDLFKRWAAREFVPVRLIGIRLECTAPGDETQASLFADPQAERDRTVDRVADAIERKFGKGMIGRGRTES
jgi:DNA polymerase-4